MANRNNFAVNSFPLDKLLGKNLLDYYDAPTDTNHCPTCNSNNVAEPDNAVFRDIWVCRECGVLTDEYGEVAFM